MLQIISNIKCAAKAVNEKIFHYQLLDKLHPILFWHGEEKNNSWSVSCTRFGGGEVRRLCFPTPSKTAPVVGDNVAFILIDTCSNEYKLMISHIMSTKVL